MRAAGRAVRTLLAESWQYAFAIGCGAARRRARVRHTLAEVVIEMITDHAQHVLYAARASVRGRVGYAFAEGAIEVAAHYAQYVLNALATSRTLGITTLSANEG